MEFPYRAQWTQIKISFRIDGTSSPHSTNNSLHTTNYFLFFQSTPTVRDNNFNLRTTCGFSNNSFRFPLLTDRGNVIQICKMLRLLFLYRLQNLCVCIIKYQMLRHLHYTSVAKVSPILKKNCAHVTDEMHGPMYKKIMLVISPRRMRIA